MGDHQHLNARPASNPFIIADVDNVLAKHYAEWRRAGMVIQRTPRAPRNAERADLGTPEGKRHA
jgi:hypothetical protein